MTIKDLALELGRSQQAIYKRLSRAGIDPKALRHKGGSDLTEEGERIIRELYAAAQEEATAAPPSPAKDDSTGLNAEVDALRSEVERLKSRLTEEKHRAELAEAREEAAANERDFLRIQLDNAIKASVLASVKRLQAPEDPLEPPPDTQLGEVEEAPQEAQEPQRKAPATVSGIRTIHGRKQEAQKPQQKAPAAAPRSFRQRWMAAINAWKGKA